MGLLFRENTRRHGPFFQNLQNFGVFAMVQKCIIVNTLESCLIAMYFSFKIKTKNQNKQTNEKHSKYIHDLSYEGNEKKKQQTNKQTKNQNKQTNKTKK